MSNKLNPLNSELPLWLREDGDPVACTEKIKVLNENYLELKEMLRNALEDGILLGCSEVHLRALVRDLVDTVQLEI